MTETPFLPLTFIAGPAVLTNACAILQSSATQRYGLAIPQWREFRASLAAQDARLAGLYADPAAALALCERRIRLLLRGLDLLYAAVAVFGLTSLLGLAGALLGPTGTLRVSAWPVAGAGGLGFLLLLGAMLQFTLECRCARALLRLQLQLDARA